MAINVDLKVWMRAGMNLILFPTLIATTCSCAAIMLGVFMDYRYPAHESAVSSANLIFCALINTVVINDRYNGGMLADVVIESPLVEARSKYRRSKKTDNVQRLWGNDGDENEENESALGWTWANVSAMIRSEILVSLGHAAWVALVTIACITASRHAITDLFCHTSITLLDYMFCPDYSAYNYLSMAHQIFLASVMLQVFPLFMLFSLKKVLLSPVTFIATPVPSSGSIESSASLRKASPTTRT